MRAKSKIAAVLPIARTLQTFAAAATLVGMERLGQALDDAEDAYGRIAAGVVARLDSKSDNRHLSALREGVALFRRLAELGE